MQEASKPLLYRIAVWTFLDLPGTYLSTSLRKQLHTPYPLMRGSSFSQEGGSALNVG